MDGDSRKNPMIFVDVWKMQFPRTHTVNPEISSSWFFFLFTVKPRRDWKFTGRFTVFDTNSPAGTRRVFRKTGFYTKSWRLERNQTIFRLITFGSLPLSFSCSTDWQSIFSVSLLQTRSKNNRARLGQGKFTHADFPGKWLLNNQQASTRSIAVGFPVFCPHTLSRSLSRNSSANGGKTHTNTHTDTPDWHGQQLSETLAHATWRTTTTMMNDGTTTPRLEDGPRGLANRPNKDKSTEKGRKHAMPMSIRKASSNGGASKEHVWFGLDDGIVFKNRK